MKSITGMLSAIAMVLFLNFNGIAGTGDVGWMKTAKYGVFMHYQYRICLGYSTAAANPMPTQFPPAGMMTAQGWNHIVDAFDVTGFAAQMVQAQVGWVTFCIDDHYFAWPCSPNSKFSSYTGYAPGQKCSNRDLILDLANALNAKGIKLICYFAGLNGYMKEPQVSAGLADGAWRGNWNETSPPPAESRKRRLEVLKEYADRWGTKIAGWWFDGMETNTYSGSPNNWQTLDSIVHHGNPHAGIAFSYGPNEQACVAPGVDDYTGGDTWSPVDLTHFTPSWKPAQNNILWHGKIYCGNIYHGLGTANQYSDQQLITWIKTVSTQGGVCTLDWPFDTSNGHIKNFGIQQMINVGIGVKGVVSENQPLRVNGVRAVPRNGLSIYPGGRNSAVMTGSTAVFDIRGRALEKVLGVYGRAPSTGVYWVQHDPSP